MVKFLEDKIESIKSSKPATIIEEVAEAGRKAYCNLYNNHPTWVLVKDNFTLPIVTRYINKLCTEDGVPPDPNYDLPFEGGQCEVEYIFYVDYEVRTGTSPETWDDRTKFIDRYDGPITSVNANLVGDNRFFYSIDYQNGDFSDSGLEQPAGTFGVIRNPSPRLERGDGLPDDCGDPPPLPDPPPPPETPIEETITVENVNNEFNDYDVVFNKDVNNTVIFPPVINVNGVNVTIDITGIDVGDESNNLPSGGDDGEGDPVVPLPPSSERPAPTEEETGTEEEEDTENLVAVKVAITDVPANDSFVSSGSQLSKIYPGWVIFKEGSYHHPRIFIDFRDSIYYAPENADGYIVYLKPGYTGVVTKVVESNN